MSRNFGKEMCEAVENNDKKKVMEIVNDCVTSNFLKIQNLFNPINGAEQFCVYAAVKMYLSALERMDKKSAEMGESLIKTFEMEGFCMVVPNTPESRGEGKSNEKDK